MFQPHFTITPRISKALMDIEASRQAVVGLPLTVEMLDSLRKTARLLSTHFSTQIEGNKLTASQVEDILAGGGRFPGRERDEAEVRNHAVALEFVVEQARAKRAMTETLVRTTHGLVMTGRPKPTKYRDAQNVIRDDAAGRIVYLPPEAKDVPRLMKDLALWTEDHLRLDELPTPLVAGLTHYQFATIHPYFDGNGRTARLLATFVLHRGGYGLHGIYSLEEYYAQNLTGYYDSLSIGGSHNYYFGRAEADVTKFLDYFCRGMAESFAKVRGQAERAQRRGDVDRSVALRELTDRERRMLSLFRRSKTVASREVAAFFRISTRAASALCVKLAATGFLAIADASKKARRYQLAEEYETLVAE